MNGDRIVTSIDTILRLKPPGLRFLLDVMKAKRTKRVCACCPETKSSKSKSHILFLMKEKTKMGIPSWNELSFKFFWSFLLLFPLSFLLQTILQRFLVTYFTRLLRTICLKEFPITVDVTYLFVAAWTEEGNCQARSHASRPSLILPKAGKIWLQLDSVPDSGSHVSVATDSLPPTPHWAQGGT